MKNDEFSNLIVQDFGNSDFSWNSRTETCNYSQEREIMEKGGLEVDNFSANIERLQDEQSVEFCQESIKNDIDVILWSIKLCSIRRYFHQRFWEEETQESEFAARIEPLPRLESVAEHSWHVADIVLVLGGYFPKLNIDRCLKLAILHDKMEISTGDKNPLGKNGTGSKTHAFNNKKRREKDEFELDAIKTYLNKLSPPAQSLQKDALYEILEGRTDEARFVKAVDKLQAFSYVLIKKKGNFQDRHLRFTLRYSEKVLEYFPLLSYHYGELRRRLILQVARQRNTSTDSIEAIIKSSQLELNFEEIE